VLTRSVPTSSPKSSQPSLVTGGALTLTAAGSVPKVVKDWTSVGGRTNAALLGLALPPNRWIFVEVRATNGAGLVSVEGSSPPLRFDPTGPAFAAGATTAPVLMALPYYTTSTYNVAGYTVPLLATCGNAMSSARGTATKVWDGRLVSVVPDSGVVGGGGSYRVTMTRPDATDGETGIAAYWFRIDTVAPTGGVSPEGWSDIIETGATFTAMGQRLVYGRPRWISLVAVNSAGRMSSPLTHGPYQVNDGSAPNAPAFCGDFASGGFIAYMTTPSTDAESGVRGYQVRVRGPNGAIVRNFPSGTAVDWPANQAVAGQGIRIPLVPGIGGQHIVDLRAVNGAGQLGEVASSGQLLVDVTAAPVAGVNATLTVTGVNVNLSLANDPESGLAGVDIAFGTGLTDLQTKGSSLLVPYATYAAAAGTTKITIPLASTVLQSAPLYVYVRVRNGAGLVSGLTAFRIR